MRGQMEPKVTNKPVTRSHPGIWIIVILSIILLSLSVFFLANRHTRTIVGGLVSDPAESLQTSDGRTNIVFLGIGGKSHQAPDLTDSIIVMSLRHSDHSVAMLSLPRDIWVDTLKAKINTAYHYGNERRVGGGRDLSKSAVSEVVGIPIHYVIILDFEGFVKAIDAIGGIDVMVDRAFDDYEYPIPGMENAEPESSRYEHIHFDAGSIHMDGTTALKFARSRHSEGDEGTDFARGARQQKIILAFKDKLLASQTLLDKDKLTNVVDSFRSSIDTDIGEDNFGALFRSFLAFEKSGSKIKTISIENYFINPKNKTPYQGQWVLVPGMNWNEVHEYIKANLE